MNIFPERTYFILFYGKLLRIIEDQGCRELRMTHSKGEAGSFASGAGHLRTENVALCD